MATLAKGKRDGIKVFASEGGDRIIRRTDRETAEIFEAMGVWRPEYCTETGALKGYRLVGAEARRGDADVRTMKSTTGISAAEMQLNVARSRTARLREMERLTLQKDGKQPEDRVERVQAKVRVWAQIGPERGDIVRVWPTR